MTEANQQIPLSKLVPASCNVRRTGRNTGIDELAASIEAHGLLQNLTVRRVPKGQKNAGAFEVIAGGRRLAALKTLAKRKTLPKHAPIPCRVIADDNAEEISLAENVLQCAMHPADQYEAFAKLHSEQGMSAEDIAARFGVTPAVVRQRFKLGAISPVLMEAYRAGELNLDQLSAFAITDDHAKQERVWEELPQWHASRASILRALGEGHVASDDRRAVFVGAEAYEAAGGAIVRDLFDPEGGGFFTDPELLNRLVREKLQAAAQEVMAEGWKWVAVEPEFDYQAASGMRRTHPETRVLTDEEQAKLDELAARYDEIGEGDDPDAGAELARIEAEIEALTGPETYDPDELAVAGAFVALGREGECRIERGFVRPEDEPRSETDVAGAQEASDAGADELPPLSDKLTAELTAHRTAALRDALGQNATLALAAVTHALALPVFYPYEREASSLEITPRSVALENHAHGIVESRAGRAIADRHEAWATRLPQEAEALWPAVVGLPTDECLGLLAYCAALTVNAVRTAGTGTRGNLAHADALAQALALDMTAYWEATPEGYFARVSKERILAAVREGVSPEAAQNIAGLKKTAMAEAAAQRLAGKSWLPSILRIGTTAVVEPAPNPAVT